MDVAEVPAPSAAEYLMSLNYMPSSKLASTVLAYFGPEREISQHTFQTGVFLAARLANLHPSARAVFYGNAFMGPYYANDLTDLWNKRYPNKPVKARKLGYICPQSWNYHKTFPQYLSYEGDRPSQALLQLFQGSVTIDCGMANQIFILFGILYMIGAKQFDRLFCKEPLYITTQFFKPIKKAPQSGNQLHGFFTSAYDEQAVGVVYFKNHPFYSFKHPGGSYCGENSVVQGQKYILFKPCIDGNTFLEQSKVGDILCEAMNAPPDQFDRDKIEWFTKQIDSLPILLAWIQEEAQEKERKKKIMVLEKPSEKESKEKKLAKKKIEAYKKLISLAKQYKDYRVSRENSDVGLITRSLFFDLKAFEKHIVSLSSSSSKKFLSLCL